MMLPRRCSALAALLPLWMAMACSSTPLRVDASVADAATADVFSADASLCGTVLFGRPSEKTGLDETQCAPVCTCDGNEWRPREWTEESLAALTAWTLIDAPAALESNPYDQTPAEGTLDQVCAVHVADETAHTYRLETFATRALAESSGAIVTHYGVCGLCSTLADLAVYARENDLTSPIRQCGLQSFGDVAAITTCIEALGFTHPCAQIWAYNTVNTGNVCTRSCFSLVNAPYHESDGDLNACLQCDEVMSGPVFKAIAGRTRRNTGLANAMCRPCAEVHHIDHDYPE